MQQLAGQFFKTLAEYPPSQTPGSFNLEKVQEQINNAATGK
jgi:arylsulfatase